MGEMTLMEELDTSIIEGRYEVLDRVLNIWESRDEAHKPTTLESYFSAGCGVTFFGLVWVFDFSILLN